MATATYLGGYWSTNIGNAFYDLGVLHVLRSIPTIERVYYIQDTLDYASPVSNKAPTSFWSKKYFSHLSLTGTKNKIPKVNKNKFYKNIQSEYVLMGGPIFSALLKPIWEEIFLYWSLRGKKIIFISAGGSAYDDIEKQSVRSCLEKFQPYALVTRDQQTYDVYADLFEESYSGICFAFFTPDYYKPGAFSIEDRIALSFNSNRQLPYEQICKTLREVFARKKVRTKKKFDLDSITLRLSHSFVDYYLGEDVPDSFDIVSDVPEIYLDIYAQSPLTLSDRVHACVPALAYGNFARLFADTPRANLFDRIGVPQIRNQPVRVHRAFVEQEKTKLRQFVERIFI